MGRVTRKGNDEVKSKMKHPSDMPMPSFELWSNKLPLDTEEPVVVVVVVIVVVVVVVVVVILYII